MTDLPTVAPPEPPYGSPPVATEAGVAPARRRGPSLLQRFGGVLGRAFTDLFLALVLFPLLVGLVVAGMVALSGSNYEQGFIAAAGITALCGLFVVAVKWGWQIFINFWPIILVIVVIVIAWKAFT